MKVLKIIKTNLFGLLILISAVVSVLQPTWFDTWGGVKLLKLIVPAIQLIMFGMGTTLSLQDFVQVVKTPYPVLLGAVLQFAVMPFVGFLLATLFGFDGELAAGLVLIGSVAGGTASNVISYLAKANVALSVTMTCVSTLLSPLVTPFMMKALAGRFVSIDAGAMMIEILKVVLVPVIAGSVIRRLLRNWFAVHQELSGRLLSAISMAGICFTILVLTAPSRATIAKAGALIALAAVLHNSIGYLSGYFLARLAGRFLPIDERDARTVAIEVGMQNGGMAGALAVGVLNSPVAALPANIFSIWMNFSGSLLAGYWSKKQNRGG